MIAISPVVEVIADAIEQQTGERPDELCPAFLAGFGLTAGGEAAGLARGFLTIHRSLWFDGYSPEALYDELVKRRTFKPDKPFTGLLLAEVYSAIAWQTESLRQLKEVGFTRPDPAVSPRGLRTVYRTREHDVFVVAQNHACYWHRPKSYTARKLEWPVEAQIYRALVVRTGRARVEPVLAQLGWTATDDDLLRSKPWTAHSRISRESWQLREGQRPVLPKVPHRWGDPIDGIERCERCDTSRFMPLGCVRVYRYATGSLAEVQQRRAQRLGERTRPNCKRTEGA